MVAARVTDIMQTHSYFFLREYAAKWTSFVACTATNAAASLAVLERSNIDGTSEEPTSSMAK